MTSTRLSTPFAIYEDPSAFSPQSSPYSSDAFDPDSSDLFLPEDHLVTTIEPFPDPITTHSPRRTSAMTTTTSISSLPPELLPGSSDMSPYTPMKARPPFRNPSSVRALQRSSPPPFASPWYASSRDGTPSQRTKMSREGTPISVRSRRGLDSGARRARAESSLHPHPDPAPASESKNQPLVLLHATILPHVCPYSAESMQAVLPPWILENHRLLEEKMSEMVLGRGILIPHPREEYDLLEERLLESLELRPPRILRCGHFHAVDSETEEAETGGAGERGRGSRCSSRDSGTVIGADEGVKIADTTDDGDYGSDGDGASDTCPDCLAPVKPPYSGAGSGKRRWDVRIYAANGLMRAGAWAAAWGEMERVDVEIGPWIPEELRRELDRRREVEEEEEEEAERRVVAEVGTAVRSRRSGKVREQSLVTSTVLREKARRVTLGESAERPRTPRVRPREEIPLATLLRNYLYLLAQDRRNIAIFILSFLILLLAMQSGRPREAPARLPDVVIADPLIGNAMHSPPPPPPPPPPHAVLAVSEDPDTASAGATSAVLATEKETDCGPPVTVTEHVTLTNLQEASSQTAPATASAATADSTAVGGLSADGPEEPSLSQSLVEALGHHVNVLAGDGDANVLDDLASSGGAVDVEAGEVHDMLS